MRKLNLIDIGVTHFGDKYSTKYIDNLQNGIARNYSGNFNFMVKTNCPNRHWDKIDFFDCSRRTVIMDIDMIINGNLDELFTYPVETFGAFKRWWRGNNDINGGFYIVEPTESNYLVRESFYMDPEAYISRYSNLVGTPWMGEQAFVDDHTVDKTYLPGEWLGVRVDGAVHKGVKQEQSKFDSMYQHHHGNLNMLDNSKLLHFIYEQQIEDHEQWIQDLWNGTSSA